MPMVTFREREKQNLNCGSAHCGPSQTLAEVKIVLMVIVVLIFLVFLFAILFTNPGRGENAFDGDCCVDIELCCVLMVVLILCFVVLC